MEFQDEWNVTLAERLQDPDFAAAYRRVEASMRHRRDCVRDQPVLFRIFDSAGRWTFRVGSAVHKAGLTLCGFAGHLDAIADSRRR